MVRRILVTGAGGFIGGHLVRRLLGQDADVVAVDIRPMHAWQQTFQSLNIVADLRELKSCTELTSGIDTVYHLAADMGGIGYISRADWECALSSIMTANVLRASLASNVKKFIYTSSACVYPMGLQAESTACALNESMAIPASPEGGYGWEKLFSEQLCRYASQKGRMETRLARLFNVYGTHCDWNNGKEKAPAALARKVAEAVARGQDQIEVWGDGTQRRSFLHVSDCVDALTMMEKADLSGPVNIASTELVTITELAQALTGIAQAELTLTFTQMGPTGVHTRIPDISQAWESLRWSHQMSLQDGLAELYAWVYENVIR